MEVVEIKRSGVEEVQGIVRFTEKVKQSRQERRMLREFHAASPRVQQELSAVLRRQG